MKNNMSVSRMKEYIKELESELKRLTPKEPLIDNKTLKELALLFTKARMLANSYKLLVAENKEFVEATLEDLEENIIKKDDAETRLEVLKFIMEKAEHTKKELFDIQQKIQVILNRLLEKEE